MENDCLSYGFCGAFWTKNRYSVFAKNYYGIWSVEYSLYSPGLVTYTYNPNELAKTMVKTMAVGGVMAGAFYMFGPAAALVFI